MGLPLHIALNHHALFQVLAERANISLNNMWYMFLPNRCIPIVLHLNLLPEYIASKIGKEKWSSIFIVRYLALQAAPPSQALGQGKCQARCESAESSPSACLLHRKGTGQCFRCEWKKLNFQHQSMLFSYLATEKCCLNWKWWWQKCLLIMAAWVHVVQVQ